MAQSELDSLIINNLADLEAALRHVQDALEPSVAEALNNIAKTFLIKEDWDGEASWYSENDDIWLAAKDWRQLGDDNGEKYTAWFSFEKSPDKISSADNSWLTELLGIGRQRWGLRWKRSNDDISPKEWKNVVVKQSEIIARIRSLGFDYEESKGSFFLQVRVDQKTLAQAFSDESPDVALSPFAEALQTCLKAKPHFDDLIYRTAIKSK